MIRKIAVPFFCFSIALALISMSTFAQEITAPPTKTPVTKVVVQEQSADIIDARSMPCTTLPSGMPASCTDATPDKTWGNGDIWTNWCGAKDITVTGGGSCTSSSSDITCTSGNSTSYWASFQYNPTWPQDIGDMAGFKLKGSGTKGEPVYAQVYDASGCSIGGCQSQATNKDSLSLSGLGLTAGSTYYIRMWAVSGNAGSPASMTGATVGCRLTNMVNNFFDNASPLCQLGQTVHSTTNGTTAQDGGASDCGFERDGPWGEVTFLSKCGAGKNINTNDSWYKFCYTTGGTTTVSATNLSCKGTTGIQYWIMSDGTGGANNNNSSGNDFCNGDNWVSGGSSYEFTMVDCSSEGTATNSSLTVSLGTGCHYIMTDGYQADFCDFDMGVSCPTCVLANALYVDAGTDGTVSGVTIGGSPTATGGTSPFTYAWTCSPTPCNLSSTTTANPTASPTVTTTYFVTVTDANGCVIQDQMVITLGGAAVTLTDFKASVSGTAVKLFWTTLTEDKNKEFIIQRTKITEGSSGNFENAGTVEGSGTSTEPKYYYYTDKNVPPGTYAYRLEMRDYDGRMDYSNTIEIVINPPSEFTVFGTVPNPFKDVITFNYSIPQKSSVQIKVFNLVGQEVFSQDIESEKAGYYSLELNLGVLRQGVYVYRITNGSKSFEGKIVRTTE